jgi:hypothetical protein
MKIRIDKLDVLFSKYIRARDKVCKRCGNGNTKLDCAHFHGRSEKSIRWDEDNACALCYGDHAFLDSHPIEKIEFFQNLLGQEKYDLLNARRRIRERPDKAALTLYYKILIERMGE